MIVKVFQPKRLKRRNLKKLFEKTSTVTPVFYCIFEKFREKNHKRCLAKTCASAGIYQGN